MTIREYLDNQYPLQTDIGQDGLTQYRSVIRRLERYLGRTATLDDLQDDLINGWIAAECNGECEGRKMARATIQGYQAGIRTIWRAAFRESMVSLPPRRLRPVKVPSKAPEAWRLDEVQLLLKTCDMAGGPDLRFRGAGLPRGLLRLTRRHFWRAFVLVAWDSGLRLGDLLRLRADQVQPDGAATIVQNKTGWPVRIKLSPEALEAIRPLVGKGSEFVFADWASKKQVFDDFKKLMRAAGLKGGTKKLRKSSATAIEAKNPGAATGFLGHMSPKIAAKHYIDPRLATIDRPAPPPLVETMFELGGVG